MWFVFFFKQKTAYEMRISDWSSDVCSSDLQPDRVDAEFGDVVELVDEAGEIADAVAIAIAEALDVQLIDDRVLVPERIIGERRVARCFMHAILSGSAHDSVHRRADAQDRERLAAARVQATVLGPPLPEEEHIA